MIWFTFYKGYFASCVGKGWGWDCEASEQPVTVACVTSGSLFQSYYSG